VFFLPPSPNAHPRMWRPGWSRLLTLATTATYEDARGGGSATTEAKRRCRPSLADSLHAMRPSMPPSPRRGESSSGKPLYPSLSTDTAWRRITCFGRHHRPRLVRSAVAICPTHRPPPLSLSWPFGSKPEPPLYSPKRRFFPLSNMEVDSRRAVRRRPPSILRVAVHPSGFRVNSTLDTMCSPS
jgi:hypothetical protein